MKRAGLQDKIAMEINGHRTRFIFDRHNTIHEGDLGRAAEKLELCSRLRICERA
jgi:hypothetical protein